MNLRRVSGAMTLEVGDQADAQVAAPEINVTPQLVFV